MSRRLLAALAALALTVQAGGVLEAFAAEPQACCCARRGKEHQCDCPDCARERSLAAGHCSLGTCSTGAGALVLASPASPFLPACESAEAPSPIFAATPWPQPAPPRAPERDVPTPPPLFN